MKTIYLECNMGAAGDMLMAALLELHGDAEDFLTRLNGIGIPGVSISAIPSVKCGITGTHISVEVNGEHESEHHHSHHGHGHHDHSGIGDIEHIIDHLRVSQAVKENAKAVYGLIAKAESHAHGVPVSHVHFHEVGTMDAVTDIVGVCMLMEELAPDLVLSSPINTGKGFVRCAHGVLSVPAPATAFILKGTPMYNDDTDGELCTPTGAALVRHFASKFCAMPVMTAKTIGYGMGKKDFDKVNCVRAYLGDIDSGGEQVVELVCNLDDMTPEAIAYAQQRLFEAGALDVYTGPIGMKKGRTGFSFACMCQPSDKEKMLRLMFEHTATLGIREYVCPRYTLKRQLTEVQTEYGAVRVKIAHGFGVKKYKPEHEDVARIALEHGIPIRQVLDEIVTNNI